MDHSYNLVDYDNLSKADIMHGKKIAALAAAQVEYAPGSEETLLRLVPLALLIDVYIGKHTGVPADKQNAVATECLLNVVNTCNASTRIGKAAEAFDQQVAAKLGNAVRSE